MLKPKIANVSTRFRWTSRYRRHRAFCDARGLFKWNGNAIYMVYFI